MRDALHENDIITTKEQESEIMEHLRSKKSAKIILKLDYPFSVYYT
jgi:DNA helicase IV